MITAGDLRPGSTIDRGGELYVCVDFQHVKQGRGTAFVRAKFKNLLTGSVTEETFRPEEKFDDARIEHREAQYLYKEDGSYIVMDMETFDQYPISSEDMGSATQYLKENDTLTVMQYGDRLVGVELPITVDLVITETAPGFKGDTANPGTKPATLETGASIDVPLFVSEGDTIRIDTRNGKYIERV